MAGLMSRSTSPGPKLTRLAILTLAIRLAIWALASSTRLVARSMLVIDSSGSREYWSSLDRISTASVWSWCSLASISTGSAGMATNNEVIRGENRWSHGRWPLRWR